MLTQPTPTVSIFQLEDAQPPNYNDILVQMWLEEQEDDISIHNVRNHEQNINCQQKPNQTEQNMKLIGGKLNRLEQTWLHQYKNPRTPNQAEREMSGKYEELNSINHKINNVLHKMALQNKIKPGLDSVKRKLIAMYNRSVQVLTDQDRYAKRAQICKDQKEVCLKAVQQTTQQIQNNRSELQRILAIRQLTCKKLTKLQNVFSRAY